MSENPTVGRQRGGIAGQKGSTTGRDPPSRYHLSLMIVAAGLLIAVLISVASYIEKWLWMRQLDYVGIFWTLLSVQWVMFCSAFVFAFLYLWINLGEAAKNSAALRVGGPWSLDLPRQPFLFRTDAAAQRPIGLPPRLLKAATVLISAGIALFFASGFYAEWDTYLRFRYGGSFGVSDPLFGVDVGFYVFHLPFYVLLQSSLTLLTVLTIGIVLATNEFQG